MENISNSNQNQRRNDDCSAELSIEKKAEAEAEEDRSPLSMQSDGCINDKENSISNSNSNSNNSNEEIGGGNNLNGRWDKKEHLLFLKGCLLYENNWKKVQKYVKTRSSSQIRSHAQKYLIKLSKKHQALVTKTINGHSNSNLNGNGVNGNGNGVNGNGSSNGSGANYAFKSMSNEQLDAFIDNINESSNEMNSIEEYILAIFQPELKFQEALNAANINQRRGRKTEPKKKQRIFSVAKCYDIRDYKKNIKNDELLTYLNSNDPQDLSKLLSMVTNSYVNDLLKNGTSNTNTNTNSNSNGNGNTTVMSSNSFTLPQKDSLSQLVFNNIVNTTQQQQPNAIPLSFPITSMPLVPPLTMPMTTPSSSSSPYFPVPLPVTMPFPLPVSVPGQFPMMPMPSIPTTIEEANKLNMFNMPTFPFQIPHHPQSQQSQGQSQSQVQGQQQQQQSPSHQTQGMPNMFNIPGHNVDVLMSTLQKMATHPTSKFY